MKKLIILIMLMLCCIVPSYKVYAYDGETDKPFVVYTDTGEYLFEKSDVAVNDSYISKEFKMYDIISIDKDNKTAIAKYVKDIKKPNVDVSDEPSPIGAYKKKICLYLTHNDESYVPTDGYDSIYGAGGVHDVARAIKSSFENLGIDVTLDETLHIPHNSTAYARSEVTAKNLLNTYSPDAMFDIHRDGVGRSYYVTNVDGEERCKVRIVVGKANPNMDENLEFAVYLLSVAEEKYPWLFADIYYARGHYNQALYNKMLLFEMGTYLVEKELVLKSVPPLTDVVNTALYGTTVDDKDNNIVIGGNTTTTTPTINGHLNNLTENNKTTSRVSLIIITVTFAGVVGLMVMFVMKNHKGKISNNKKKSK